MSGLGRKLTKLRRNPRLFVYDLVATQRGSRGASWLLARMVGISTEAIAHLAMEQETIKPLQAALSERITRYGVTEMTRAASAAIALVRADETRRAENLFIAMTMALLAHDEEALVSFGSAHASAMSSETVRSLVISLRGAGAFAHGIHFLNYLEIDDAYSRLESGLHHEKLEAEHGGAIEEALSKGEAAVRAFAAKLLVLEAPATAYHFLYSRVYSAYSEDRSFAELVTEFGERLLALAARDWTAVQVADVHLYRGNIREAARILDVYGDRANERVDAKAAQLRDLARLATTGFEHHPEAPTDTAFRSLPGQVLFALHHSAPFHSNGYATRAHGLLTAINQLGWSVVAATRMGYPHDLKGFAGREVERSSVFDGVEYLRIAGAGHSETPLHQYLAGYADALLQLTLKQEPEIIHAHSNALNGLVANRVARALGITSIYEVRGLWEVTRASRQPEFGGSEYFELLRKMEVAAAEEADAVICITEALADEMVRSGVDAGKISIVPNGVDVDRFVPRPRDRTLEEELGLGGKRVIGYIGSLVHYEGLEDLLAAVALVVSRGAADIAVLIVGDGASLEGLERRTAELGLEDIVTFTGRVPHDQVERYYSLVDVAPFPRKSLAVTEMVSPLKPFEAMAMEKIVVASDVAALTEIIEDGVNGYLFTKDDVDALAVALERALAALDPDSGARLDARAWVTEHRSWKRMGQRLEEIYRRLRPRASRPAIINLTRVALSTAVSEVMDAYRERLDGKADHLLRRDDFARYQQVLDAISAGPRASLLDVGVGVGQFLNVVARTGAFETLRGVDVDQHETFVAFDDAFSVDHLSVASLPYADGEFSVVTCLEVIEHLDDDIFDTALKELRRVCERQLVLTVPFRERILAEDHKRRFDLADLERLFPTARITVMRKGNSQLGRPAYWAMIDEPRAP